MRSGESGEVSGEIGLFFSVFWANRFLLHREQKQGLFAAAAAKAGLVGVARDLTAHIDLIQRLATRGSQGKIPRGTPSGFLLPEGVAQFHGTVHAPFQCTST